MQGLRPGHQPENGDGDGELEPGFQAMALVPIFDGVDKKGLFGTGNEAAVGPFKV